MSFQDDAVEPLAVESAEHFTVLLKRAATRDEGKKFVEPALDRAELKRPLPRELGN